MSQTTASILSRAGFFEGLSQDELDLIAAISEARTYHRGHILFKENESSDELYVIGEGAVEILMNTELEPSPDAPPIVVARLVPGQALGEIALVDQGVRSATARIGEDDTCVVRLPRKYLMDLCRTHPELGFKVMKNLAADLAFKMRIADLSIRQYQAMLSESETQTR